MILHTIIPYSIVFAENSYDEGTNVTETFETIYKGERIEVISLPGERYVIKRIISTSPSTYLDPELQPGNEISI